jgi:hypothetical protein
MGESKPVIEPPPIASDSRHARSLGQRSEQHPGPACGMSGERRGW